MDRCLSREQIERAARLYKRVCDASQALGITSRSFSRLCRKYGVETPWGRKRRSRAVTQAADRSGRGGRRTGI